MSSGILSLCICVQSEDVEPTSLHEERGEADVQNERLEKVSCMGVFKQVSLADLGNCTLD